MLFGLYIKKLGSGSHGVRIGGIRFASYRDIIHSCGTVNVVFTVAQPFEDYGRDAMLFESETKLYFNQLKNQVKDFFYFFYYEWALS